MAVSLKVNGKAVTVDVAPDTPLLWVLRDHVGLTGTKFGCGVGQCGACTVHRDGVAVRSCQLKISDLAGKNITTIEGLSPDGTHALQRAWEELDVPQCGYCQAGQIMSAAGLLERSANPTDAEIDAAMNGNICRCATYIRIREGIKRAAQLKRGGPGAVPEKGSGSPEAGSTELAAQSIDAGAPKSLYQISARGN